MKISFILILSCLCLTTVFSQTSDFGRIGPVSNDTITEPAEYPGGIEEMRKYISENIVFPEIALEMNYQGKVFCKLNIDSIGNINDVTIIKGITDCPECSEECIRVIKLMPKWTPAKKNDVEVNSTYILPISFILTNAKDDKKRKRKNN